jgi:hypothetical protein
LSWVLARTGPEGFGDFEVNPQLHGLLLGYGQDIDQALARASEYVAIRFRVVPGQASFPSSRQANFTLLAQANEVIE